MKNFASVKDWELNILISFTLKKHATACETLVLYDLTFYLYYSICSLLRLTHMATRTVTMLRKSSEGEGAGQPNRCQLRLSTTRQHAKKEV